MSETKLSKYTNKDRHRHPNHLIFPDLLKAAKFSCDVQIKMKIIFYDHQSSLAIRLKFDLEGMGKKTDFSTKNVTVITTFISKRSKRTFSQKFSLCG